jgi:acetyl esterase/lipase
VTYLFDPPQRFDLPLTKGRDLYFDFIYKPLLVDGSGDPILDVNGKKQYQVANYPGGAVVTLEIDTSPQTTATATISTHHATVSVDYALADAIATQVPWRIKMVVSGVDDVLAHGKTKRVD